MHYIQSVPGGKVIILEVILRKKLFMYGFRDTDISLNSTLEQHAMSSHELQSALMSMVELC
jgi:hypothetical protein